MKKNSGMLRAVSKNMMTVHLIKTLMKNVASKSLVSRQQRMRRMMKIPAKILNNVTQRAIIKTNLVT